MQDPHQQLMYLLQEKEQASPATIISLKEQLKLVADQSLRLSPDQHLEAAFVY